LDIGDWLTSISGPENLIEGYCPMTTRTIAADECGKMSGSQGEGWKTTEIIVLSDLEQ
jgi:hypothetical protein